MAMDISAVGAKVVFTGDLKCEIDEFSDEGTPFECSDVDVSENAKTLNGMMISSRKPSVYPFSVTVIPGSMADVKLSKFLRESSIQPGNANTSEAKYCDCTITIPAGYAAGSSVATESREVTYTSCRIKSGPTGPSTSAEGRLSARTYNFEAESFSVK